jgi:hypothetical protein
MFGGNEPLIKRVSPSRVGNFIFQGKLDLLLKPGIDMNHIPF